MIWSPQIDVLQQLYWGTVLTFYILYYIWGPSKWYSWDARTIPNNIQSTKSDQKMQCPLVINSLPGPVPFLKTSNYNVIIPSWFLDFNIYSWFYLFFIFTNQFTPCIPLCLWTFLLVLGSFSAILGVVSGLCSEDHQCCEWSIESIGLTHRKHVFQLFVLSPWL